MRSVTYSSTGGPEVLSMMDRPVPECGANEVRVRILVSGVNPTDWKSRAGDGPGQPTAFPVMVPNQDGSGVVDAVGADVPGLRPGDRVWVWEAAYERAEGTAQEYVVLPARQVVPLPDAASFDLGASLGIPALTAHRCLTVMQGRPERLDPGSLHGACVLVIGGAGAVGNATIQLARWAGARVVATVSSPEKADLARRAGAHEVVDYIADDWVDAIRRAAPDGVDLIVEVAPVMNAVHYPALLAPNATVSIYAFGGGADFTFPVQSHFGTNTRIQFVLVYTVPPSAKDAAVADVRAAVEAGALRVGAEHGLPLHRFPLDQAAAAHAAVESGAVGKVVIDTA
ncbi:MAG: NADPH:quinone reductase [Actinomycetota bacterium]|nr:NADPH:quinone reductase [Actinomycetota bacterium]